MSQTKKKPQAEETELFKKTVGEYLDKLVWDRKPRLDKWLIDYAGAEDTPRTRMLARRVLVAAVRRARQPGCTFDQLLVLEGPQGSCKTRALQVLAVEEEWFTQHDMGGSDRGLIEATVGKWIVEAESLSHLSAADVAALKARLSRSQDEARMAYEREVTCVPRAFMLIGTSNQNDYLVDATGNRRYWTVRINCFNLDRLAADRDQIWAEASVAEAAGEKINFAMDER